MVEGIQFHFFCNKKIKLKNKFKKDVNDEIHGIPVKNNENIVNIAMELGTVVDYPTTEAVIDSFYRALTYDVSRRKSIVLKFKKVIKN